MEGALKFNGGGHLNHTLFWENLCTKEDSELKDGPLKTAIEAKYGDVESMKQELSAMSVGVQGSGWGWLGYNSKSGKFFKIMILSRFSLPSTLNLYITPCCFFGMLRIH